MRSGAILPPAEGSALRSFSALSQLCARWLPEVSVNLKEEKKNCFRRKIRAIFLLVGGLLLKGTIGLTLPGSHLKAYQVTLSDSVTMANNLTKAIVFSSPSPGQITDQSEFI